MKYVVLLERGKDNYNAYAPDLDGCVAAAETKEETIELMQVAMQEHVRFLKESGEEIPVPSTDFTVLEV